MSENLSQPLVKVTSSKFSSESVKTVSKAKISSEKRNDILKNDENIELESNFESPIKRSKMYVKHCKSRKYRMNLYKSKNKRTPYDDETDVFIPSFQTKVCRTSPSIRNKSDVISVTTINSVSNSDGVNCSLKVNSGWKLKKVLNKLRRFTKKLTPNQNFSQIRVWSNSTSQVEKSVTNPHLSSHSWSSKHLIEKLSWRKKVTQDSLTNTNTDRTDSSNCTTCVNEEYEEYKDKSIHSSRHSIKESDFLKSQGSLELEELNFRKINESKSNENSVSEKSVNVTIVNLEENSSCESIKTSESCLKSTSESKSKLHQLESVPALRGKVLGVQMSYEEAPTHQSLPKVTIVFDKLCQTPSNSNKVTASTSCTNANVCPKYSDKEIQNELNLLKEPINSINKMCQTFFSDEKINIGQKAILNLPHEQTCKEALNEVNQLASELIEVAVRKNRSNVKISDYRKSDGRPNLVPKITEGEKMSKCQRNQNPTFEHHSSCIYSTFKESKEAEKCVRKKLDDEKHDKKMESTESCAMKNFISNSQSQNHIQEKQIFHFSNNHSCCRNTVGAFSGLSNSSNPENMKEKGHQSVGFIQKPAVLKSSSSFIQPLEGVFPVSQNCYTCNIHSNPDKWKSKDSSCCNDFPFNRANFLKLYPEPYINCLSKNMSKVELIFQRKNKNQKQLYICQECKKNASWNRFARKCRLRTKWQKSTSTSGSHVPSHLMNGSSSSICNSQPSTESFYRCKKFKNTVKRKKKLKNYSKYRFFKKNYSTQLKLMKEKRRQKYEMRISDDHSSSSYYQGMKQESCDHLNNLFVHSNADVYFPPSSPPLSIPLLPHPSTDMILPPPPPLYEYPPYNHRSDFSEQMYRQNLSLSPNKNNRTQYPVGSTINKNTEKITADQQQFYTHRNSSMYRQLQTFRPSVSSKKYELIRSQTPKQVRSSNSENSAFNLAPCDKRYEREKIGADYFYRNKTSNYLLKYRGYGDCPSMKPTLKLKSKITPSNSTAKVRKKIRDKYKRDETSVRCLLRNAIAANTKNDEEKQNFSLKKSKLPVSPGLPISNSTTKVTTLFLKPLDNFIPKSGLGRIQPLFKDPHLMNKPMKSEVIELSKNPFCLLSDSMPTSESMVKANSSEKMNRTREKVIKSESIPMPKLNKPVTKIMERHSEEFARKRTVSINKRHVSSNREIETLELFHNAKQRSKLASPPPKLCDDLTTSDESIVQYFKLLDRIAEKRRQFKKEERRRMKIHDLKEKQLKLF